MAQRQSPEEKELIKTRLQLRLVAATALVVLASGTVIYHRLINLSWMDALYFSTITLATVGYGDIVPKTPIAKLFTIFYVLIGIGIIATFASLLIKNAGAKRAHRHEQHKDNNKD